MLYPCLPVAWAHNNNKQHALSYSCYLLHGPTTITNNMLYPTVLPGIDAHNNNKQHVVGLSYSCTWHVVGPQQ